MDDSSKATLTRRILSGWQTLTQIVQTTSLIPGASKFVIIKAKIINKKIELLVQSLQQTRCRARSWAREPPPSPQRAKAAAYPGGSSCRPSTTCAGPGGACRAPCSPLGCSYPPHQTPPAHQMEPRALAKMPGLSMTGDRSAQWRLQVWEQLHT